jgi:hypothetical protein
MSMSKAKMRASEQASPLGWSSAEKFSLCLELLICTNTHFALDGGREHGTCGRMEKELFYEFYGRNQDVTTLAC